MAETKRDHCGEGALMSYRHRMQLRNDRRQQRNKEEREDRVLFAEPHLRDYEAAVQELGGTVQARYEAGWVYVSGSPGYGAKVRLNQLIAMTATLQAQVHERNIQGGNE